MKAEAWIDSVVMYDPRNSIVTLKAIVPRDVRLNFAPQFQVDLPEMPREPTSVEKLRAWLERNPNPAEWKERWADYGRLVADVCIANGMVSKGSP